MSGVPGTRIGVGMMRINVLDPDGVRALYSGSRDAGVTLFDHADIYGGGNHECEKLFGESVTLSPTEREEIVIQSKVGIRKGIPEYDFSKEHILRRVDESLAALRTDYLDTLLLHRPDTLVEPDEVAAAFDELEASGKVRYFGVSNHTVAQMQLLEMSVKQPLVANQVQFGLGHAALVAHGIAANMEEAPQSVDRDGGLLEYARLNGVTLQAWSPFQHGFLGGTIFESNKHPELRRALERISKEYGTTPSGIATAWITRHPAKMQVIVGTTHAERVAQAVEGSEITLTRAEWYELFKAAGYQIP